MMNDIVRYKTDYSVLAVFAGSYVLYFLQNQSAPHNLVLATILFALSYLAWGVWHHSRIGSLSKSVMLEYLLVGIFGIVIVSSLLI